MLSEKTDVYYEIYRVDNEGEISLGRKDFQFQVDEVMDEMHSFGYNGDFKVVKVTETRQYIYYTERKDKYRNHMIRRKGSDKE